MNHNNKHRDPVKNVGTICVALGLLVFAALWFFSDWPWYWAWWTGFSLIAFLVYGFDKIQAAKTGAWRIPERTLHLLALVGGVAGAWIGRFVFRHKTRHWMFTLVLIAASTLHFLVWRFIIAGQPPITP